MHGWEDFFYSPFSAVIFLAIGVDAIFQAIITIMKWLKEENENQISSTIVFGIEVGMLVMYFTSILV